MTTWRWYDEGFGVVLLEVPPQPGSDRWVIHHQKQGSHAAQRIGRDWDQVLVRTPATGPFELQLTTQKHRRRRANRLAPGLLGEAEHQRYVRFDPEITFKTRIEPNDRGGGSLILEPESGVRLELQSQCWPRPLKRPRVLWRHMTEPDQKGIYPLQDLSHPGAWTYLEICPWRDQAMGPTLGFWAEPGPAPEVRVCFTLAGTPKPRPRVEFEVGPRAICLPHLTIIQLRKTQQRSIPVDLSKPTKVVDLPDVQRQDRFAVIGPPGVPIRAEIKLPNGILLSLKHPSVEFRGDLSSTPFLGLKDWYPRLSPPSAASRLLETLSADRDLPAELEPALTQLAERLPGLLTELHRQGQTSALLGAGGPARLQKAPPRVLVQWAELITQGADILPMLRQQLGENVEGEPSALDMLLQRPQIVQPLVREPALAALVGQTSLIRDQDPLSLAMVIARMAGDPPGLEDWLSRAGPTETRLWADWLESGQPAQPLLSLRWERRLDFDLDDIEAIQRAIDDLSLPGWNNLAHHFINESPLAQETTAALNERNRVLAGEVEGDEVIAAVERLWALGERLADELDALTERRPSVPGRWKPLQEVAVRLRQQPIQGLMALKLAEDKVRGAVQNLPRGRRPPTVTDCSLVVDQLLLHLQAGGLVPHRRASSEAMTWLAGVGGAIPLPPWPAAEVGIIDDFSHDRVLADLLARIEQLGSGDWQALITDLGLDSDWEHSAAMLDSHLDKVREAAKALHDADPSVESQPLCQTLRTASTAIEEAAAHLLAISLLEPARRKVEERIRRTRKRIRAGTLSSKQAVQEARLDSAARQLSGGLAGVQRANACWHEVTQELARSEDASHNLEQRLHQLSGSIGDALDLGPNPSIQEFSAQLQSHGQALLQQQSKHGRTLAEGTRELIEALVGLGNDPMAQQLGARVSGLAPIDDISDVLKEPWTVTSLTGLLTRIERREANLRTRRATHEALSTAVHRQALREIEQITERHQAPLQELLQGILSDLLKQRDYLAIIAVRKDSDSLLEVSRHRQALLHGHGDGLDLKELLWLANGQEPLSSLWQAHRISLDFEALLRDPQARDDALKTVREAARIYEDHREKLGSLADLRQNLCAVLQRRLYRFRSETRHIFPIEILPPRATSAWGALLWVASALDALDHPIPFGASLKVSLMPLNIPSQHRARFKQALDDHELLPPIS